MLATGIVAGPTIAPPIVPLKRSSGSRDLLPTAEVAQTSLTTSTLGHFRLQTRSLGRGSCLAICEMHTAALFPHQGLRLGLRMASGAALLLRQRQDNLRVPGRRR